MTGLPQSAQTITRGPYLQDGSDARVTVRWRTDVATDSEVRYGATPTMLTSSVSAISTGVTGTAQV